MIHPSQIKTNMRYRGPMETFKMNRSTTSLAYDINRLYKRFEAMEKKLTTHKTYVMEGKKPSPVEEPVTVRSAQMERTISIIERGVQDV